MRFHAISRREGGDHDGVHLLWSPPYPAGHALDGFTIFRRDGRREGPTHCFALSASLLTAVRQLGQITTSDATVWSRPGRDPQKDPWTYRVDLVRRHSLVTVGGGPAQAIFAGLADGTVLAGAELPAGGVVTLHGTDIGVIWIVTDSPRASFDVCGDLADKEDWTNARPIVEGLQVPFASVNPAVATVADGLALAASRAQPDALGGDFDEISRYANSALQRPDGVAAWRVVSERPGEDGNAWDVAPFGLAIATTILPEWQRGLGFAHLDRDDLVPGARYDYRIVGQVRRRDRDERLFDFHTVPRGYRLPRGFRWGTALVLTSRSLVVEAISGVPGDPTTIRKGIRSDGLVVIPDAAGPRLVLEAAPGSNIQARGFRYGSSVASLSETTSDRTVIDFGTDVDWIRITGDLALTGIVPEPLNPMLDPDEPVEISGAIYGVEFAPTPRPAAPDSIAVVNLGDPSRTAARGVLDTNRGFEVTWDAPSALPVSLPPYYPADATTAPPTEVARYRLERSWAGRPFAARDGDGTQISGRNAPTPTDSPTWGFDLLQAFPPADAAPGSYSDAVRAIETFEADVLAYGDAITYRVVSVDATGRESPATTSSPTQLRKHVRPPPPTTPPSAGPTPAGVVPPSGVEVLLLQHDNPDLTAAQRALAAGGNVVRIRWGWGPSERDVDPETTEFRVYEHDGALAEIEARTTAIAAATATGWSLPVQFDRPVTADEFAGLVVVLGAAFRITAHPAGTNVTLALASNPVQQATAPAQGTFSVLRTTSAELNSESWHRRVAVVPRVPAPAGSDQVEEYEVTLPAAWIAVDENRRRQRQGIGVTAADAELYVPDRRAALEAAPRPGNESTVAAREVTARYYGRTTLVIADLSAVDGGHAAETGRQRRARHHPPRRWVPFRIRRRRPDAPRAAPRVRGPLTAARDGRRRRARRAGRDRESVGAVRCRRGGAAR